MIPQDLQPKLFLPTMRLLLFAVALGSFAAGCSSADESPAADAIADQADSIDPIVEPEETAETAETGMDRSDALLAALTIFVVSVFLGFELITKVPPTLHTPLMSGSNAISGITLVGAVLMAGNGSSLWAAFLGTLAVILAMVNVVGGFLVTDRMLSMFQRR